MTEQEIRQAFEEWFLDNYRWEIKRGVRGKKGYHLCLYEGQYTSEIAAHDYDVWVAAHKRMMK